MLIGSYQYNYYPTVMITNSNHPVTYGVSSFSNNYNYAEYISSGADVGATVLGTVDGSPAVIVGNPGFWWGVYLDPGYPYYSWGSGDADYLLENAMAWAAFGGRDQVDQFLVPVVASDNLIIKTTTPGGDPFSPDNDLDPILELYDPTGTLVASNNNGGSDGRNALITCTVSQTGNYRVRVAPVTGNGEDSAWYRDNNYT